MNAQRLEIQIFFFLIGSRNTKEPKKNNQNRLWSLMPEGADTLCLIIITLFRKCWVDDTLGD